MKKAPTASRKKKAPPGADLDAILGPARLPLAKVTDWLWSAHPDAAIDERFSNQSGWHRIYLLKKRRLFYLVPKPADFRFSMILGDKALALLEQGPCAAKVRRLLKCAKRYPEGTAFMLDLATFDPNVVIALLEAKLAH